MLDWDSLSEDQLLQYISKNLTLDEVAERVYNKDDVLIPEFIDSINKSENKEEIGQSEDDIFTLKWSELSYDNFLKFVELNTTYKDVAKDIYENNLGNRELTHDIIDLIDNKVSAVKSKYGYLIYDTVIVIASHLKYNDIINLCDSGILTIDLCSDRDFWLYYLRKVYSINNISNDRTLDNIIEGILILEQNEMVDYSDDNDTIIIEKYPEFIRILDLNRNTQVNNLDNLINLQELYLGDNNRV